MVCQKVTPADIEHAVSQLREWRKRLITAEGPAVQQRAVSALARVASFWKDPGHWIRRLAERENPGFPFSMVWQSLDPLLDSFSEDALWALIESESARDLRGADVIGHVIAANTPLLAWTSLARALLVQSSSILKLPSHPVSAWAEYFRESLWEADEQLAGLVHLCQWNGGESALNEALCRSCDLVVAYGSDETISALEMLCRPGTLLGYGHRMSFGVVTAGADWKEAARGFAKDVLLYDQGGCLSPHCLFVEGDASNAARFGDLLAQALENAVRNNSCIDTTLRFDTARAWVVREQRALAKMEAGTQLWEDPGLYWTVVAVANTGFRASPTHGVVYVAPFRGTLLTDALGGVKEKLQGAAIAAANSNEWEEWRTQLAGIGVNYLCHPGGLQCPTLAWRQNGKEILRSFVL